MEAWSLEQKKRTIDVLERVDIVAFAFSPDGAKKGCPLNHLDGRKGYITIDDALARTLRVFDEDTDELLGTYDSSDEVVAGGWKVST
ncbi:MAG: hypothetical protein GX911_00615 [Spirochaetales bacterium]|nr:hypothetical protein [Spirochaetales bacterium]